MATKAQITAFINMIAPIAIKQAAKHDGKIFPSVCIAQACLESGYGTSAKMVKANAVFGIKVGKAAYRFGTAWKGGAYKSGTTEYYDGKNPTRIQDYFRAYDTIEDSVEDYFDLLCTASRYKNALNRLTPLECITGIQMGPYATSPTYITKVMTIINNNSLTIYDTETAPPSVSYQIGSTYTTLSDLYVRDAPQGNHRELSELTQDGQRHAFADMKGAVLKKRTRVTIKEVQTLDNGAIWVRIPSGWLCAYGASGKTYIA